VEPGCAAKLPGLHSVHVDAPLAEVKLPAGHA
jgi:hypothetical protein